MKNPTRNRVLIVLMLTAFVYFGWLLFVRDSDRVFFTNHSGVRIPFGTANVVHFRKFEFAFTSHYSLPVNARSKFAQLNHFTPVAPKGWWPIFHLEDLPAPYDRLPASGTFYYLTGADTATAWDAVFHLESGDLWTSIYFADYGGDLPARVLEPPRAAVGNRRESQLRSFSGPAAPL